MAGGAPGPSAGNDWILRTVLASVLLVLLATAAGLLVTAPSGGAGASPDRSPTETSSPPASTPPSSPTTSTSASAQARYRPTKGCGFSLAADPRFDGTATSGPQAVGHCTIVEVGDSVGDQVSWGFEQHIPSGSGLTVIRLDRPSTGLAVTSFYNWPTKLATALRAYKPQAVIICLGANDQQGIYVNGSSVSFGSPAWESAYSARVQKMVDQATQAGALVLWVGLPVMQPPRYDAGSEALNHVYQQVVAANPRARFIATRAVLAGSGGRFISAAAVDGQRRTLRRQDGIHMTEAGAAVMGTYLLRQLATLFNVKLQPVDPAVITG